MNAQEYIVAFHIGRGGRYHNPGHKSFMPYVEKLSDCFGENSFIHAHDEEGNILPDEEWKLLDSGSNVILEGRDEIESDIGILNWDYNYDTDIVKYLADCDDEEIEILYKSYLREEYMPYELKEYICGCMGLHIIYNIKFYETNAEIQCHDCTLHYEWDGEEDVTEADAKEWLEDNNIDPISIERYAYDFEIHFYND